ncbi:YhdP family protein [Pseudohongiella sp. SYSU M77423]|uniref:YhdP family protein n=1 Tax=Pseudohongiella sp. SYSU M77423 TaxID=3042312 RepID=UPI00247FAC0F|nr:YhdP family protein [Pseudohongiella sp. SYSU M77423]MDH7942408.1 YhdP family protein [Pseudohongiella sp. SYSU M77423]
MIWQITRSIGRIGLRLAFWSLLTLLVLMALYVSLGRQLVPMVSDYQEQIEERLSQMLDASVKMDAIHGEWHRLSPRFVIEGLQINGRQADLDALPPALRLERVDVFADVPASLLARRLIIASAAIEQLHLNFAQSESGRWQLAGLGEAAVPPQINPEQLFQWMTALARFRLDDTQISFRPFRGDELVMADARIEFQSQGGQHQLILSAFPEMASDELRLSADLTGDSVASLQGHVYLNAPPAEYAELLASLDLSRAGGGRLELSGLQLFGEFWLDIQQGNLQGLTWRGGGNASLSVWDDSQTMVEQVTIDELDVDWLKYYQAPDDSWYLQFEGLEFAYDGGRWPDGGLTLDYLPGQQIRLHMDALDTGLASRLMLALLPAGTIRQELDTFNPRGQLRNIVMSAQPASDGQWVGAFSSNIREGAISAHRGVPAFWGVDGYAEVDFDTSARVIDGFVEVAGEDMSMQIPRLFDDVWQYSQVNGRVNVHVDYQDAMQMRLASSVVVVESPHLNARAQFALDVNETADRFINLELMVGALEADVSRKSLYLPMAAGAPRSAQGVLSWVDDAVIAGSGAGSGFIFRGHVDGGALPAERTMQMFYRVADGELKFDPEWPALEQVSGTVTVSDGEVYVLAEAGQSMGIDFQQTEASVQQNPGGGSWLTVSGTGRGTADQGLQYLARTPVTRDVAQYLSGWQAQGSADFTLSLVIPLFIEGVEPEVQLDMQFADNALYIPQYELTASDLSGQLHYSAHSGLSSTDMSGVVMGRETDFEILSADSEQGIGNTQINVTGRSSVEALLDWPGLPGFLRPILSKTTGEFEHQTQLRLGQAPELSVRTALDDVAFAYPAPFSKAAGEALPLDLRLTFAASNPDIVLTLGDRLQMRLTGGEPDSAYSGLIYLGSTGNGMQVRRLNPGAPGLEVLGEIAVFDLEAWQLAISEMMTDSRNLAGVGSMGGLSAITGTAGVRVGELLAFDERFTNVNLSLNKTNQDWRFGFDSEALAGNLVIPGGSDQLWNIDLDRLQLDYEVFDEPESAEPELVAAVDSEVASSQANVELDLEELPAVEFELPREDPLAAFDPRTLPPMRLSIDELILGEADFGSWSFELIPDAAGALFRNLQLNVRGLSIGTEEEPAEFRWIYDGQQHRSALNGIVTAQNLAPVLSSFGYAPSLESQTARFNTRLHWDGSPAYFSALGLNGDIDLQVQNGRFRQRAGVANSALRLISIINFDAIMRRLRFSGDLARTGLSYDEITGQISLRDGIVTIEDRLQIIGPASLFQLEGTVDLAAETIDADLYITLPVSDNIPWLGGLAVLNNLINWQMAVGVFIFDRIFGDQVDNLTSAHYTLEGPWEGLEPRLYQVFTDADSDD